MKIRITWQFDYTSKYTWFVIISQNSTIFILVLQLKELNFSIHPHTSLPFTFHSKCLGTSAQFHFYKVTVLWQKYQNIFLLLLQPSCNCICVCFPILIFILFYLFYYLMWMSVLFVCMYMHHMCACFLQTSELRIRSPGIGVRDSSE